MSADGPIVVREGFVIPGSELTWRYGPSGGPGGQHANRSNTRAELSWPLLTSPSISEDLRQMLIGRLGGRVRAGAVTVSVDETRSQWQNRSLARRRLAELLADASRPETPRRATKPHFMARQRRLERKRQRAETKRLRRRPEAD